MLLMDNPKPTIPDWLYGSRIDNSTHGSYAEFFFYENYCRAGHITPYSFGYPSSFFSYSLFLSFFSRGAHHIIVYDPNNHFGLGPILK